MVKMIPPSLPSPFLVGQGRLKRGGEEAAITELINYGPFFILGPSIRKKVEEREKSPFTAKRRRRRREIMPRRRRRRKIAQLRRRKKILPLGIIAQADKKRRPDDAHKAD